MKKPFVVVDRAHERQSRAGIARYSTSLVEALVERDDVKVRSIGGGPLLVRGSTKKKFLTAYQDFWWYPFGGRRMATALGADVYHCPSPRAPLNRGRLPTVITIHDLASIHYPQTLTHWSRLYERSTLRRAAHAADLIITVSNDTANDTEHWLRISAGKIRVVPSGVGEEFFTPVTGPRPFSFPYVLFVGSAQPRKNLGRLSQAVEQIAARRDLRLVIAGNDSWGSRSFAANHVTTIRNVDDEQLRSLYKHAECTALVSLHEGFGLPALEAMACGSPLVASNVAALPEVVDSAAVLVDPLSVDAIAAGIDEAVTRREALTAAGRARAREFTWRRTAELTMRVYAELL